MAFSHSVWRPMMLIIPRGVHLSQFALQSYVCEAIDTAVEISLVAQWVDNKNNQAKNVLYNF